MPLSRPGPYGEETRRMPLPTPVVAYEEGVRRTCLSVEAPRDDANLLKSRDKIESMSVHILYA